MGISYKKLYLKEQEKNEELKRLVGSLRKTIKEGKPGFVEEWHHQSQMSDAIKKIQEAKKETEKFKALFIQQREDWKELLLTIDAELMEHRFKQSVK